MADASGIIFRGVADSDIPSPSSGKFAVYLFTSGEARYKDSSGVVHTFPSVTGFNSRVGAITPLVGDYSSFYQPLDGTLTSLSALTITTNSLSIGTGADAFTQTSFAANTFPAVASTGNLVAKPITDYGLSFVALADASAGRISLGLGTTSTKNIGNTVLDSGTGSLEIAMPTSLVIATSKTYLTTDRGKAYQRSNSGAVMTDTLPTLGAGDNGWYIIVSNIDTVIGATLTLTLPSGLFPNGTNTTVLNYGCRQAYTWNGTAIVFVLSGTNATLQKPSTSVAAGDYTTFLDTTGVKIANRTIAQVKTDLSLGTAAFQPTSAFDASGAAAAAQAASQPLDGSLTALSGNNWIANALPIGNGADTMSQVTFAANSFPGISSSGSLVAKTMSDAGFAFNAAANVAAQTALLNTATQSLKGLISASDKAGIDHDSYSLINILDYGGDPTATTDNAIAIANAMAALPAVGGVIYFPCGSYLVGSNISVTKTIIFFGDNQAQSIIVLTSPTADGFTLANWNCGFRDLEIAGLATNSTGPTTGSETTLPVTQLSNFPTSGSFSYGGTAGWSTVTYTGKSASSGAGNLTGCSALPAAASGANVMIRTAGYAVNMPPVTSSGGNYNFMDNCKIYSVYNGIFFASALGFIDTLEIRNVRNVAVTVDGNNDKFINRLTTASAPIMATSVLVNLTSSLLMQQCQILQATVGMDLSPATGITIPSVEAVNCFYDNNTIGMRVTAAGTGSIYRCKFTNCWFSSATTAGVQFNTTQFDGFSFINCDFYGNGKGISATSGGGHWSAIACFFAGNTTAIDLAASATHFPIIQNCEIGPRAAFGVNTLGINIAAGTYKGVFITNNQLVNNTTNMTVGAVTVAAGEASFYRISDNAGYNPITNANVATPTFPTSTTVVTNTTGRRVLMYCKSGATAPTVITLNGVANSTILPAVTSEFTLPLEPGGTIAFTYTVALTWFWVGQ